MKDTDKSKDQLIHELTAMKQQMQVVFAKHKSDAFFSTGINSIPIPIAITTFSEGRYIYVNQSFITSSGYSSQELLDHTSLDLNTWANLDDRAKYTKLLQTQQSISNVEIFFRAKSGKIITALSSVEFIVVNNMKCMLWSSIDITELKQTQASLQQREREFKTLAEHSPDGIVRFNKSLRCVYINPIIEKVTKIPLDSFIGATLQELGYEPDTYNLWQENLLKVFTTKKTFQIEYSLKNIRGQEYYYQAWLVPELNADGSVEFALCTIRNITLLKKTENALRNNEERKQRLLNSIPDMLFRISKAGIFLDYHESKSGLLYSPPEVFKGKHISEILPAEVAEKYVYYIDKTLDSGNIQIFEYQLPIHGRQCSFEARLVAAENEEVLCIIRDTTELKRLQNELAHLDRLNLVGEMAASIGHEVRNPMTTVRGFLQMLSKKTECANFKDYFTLMIEELDRANTIISEFLSLANNKKIQLEPQKLNCIVNSLAPLIQASAAIDNKNLKLELASTPELLVDPKEIRQLILNLTRNGLEAMPSKTTLTIKTFQAGDEVVLAIQDEGCGIKPELIDKLGTPFVTTKDTGTGLGLPICYRIAARHNAVIKFDTGPTGTTFFVKFQQ